MGLALNGCGPDVPSTPANQGYSQQARLQAPEASADAQLGYYLALSPDGAFLAAGAFEGRSSSGAQTGTVHVFARNGGAWMQQARLQADDAAQGAYFGISVALSADKNTLVVGAHFASNAAGREAGSVYVFTREAGVWRRQARLRAADAAPGDHFGTAVALTPDGNELAVGSHCDDNSGGTDAGSTYIFARHGGRWIQQARLQAADAKPNAYFGVSLAYSADGGTLAISAYGDDNSAGTAAGSVYVFTRSRETWIQQARLQPHDAAAHDTFGSRVALSADGNTLAAGSYFHDTDAGKDAGSAYIFARRGGRWRETQELNASDASAGDHFGESIALSPGGDVLAVGAGADDNSGGKDAGSAYLFIHTAKGWTQLTRLQADDAAAGDSFGSKVALSSDGSVVAIGAYRAANADIAAAGAVYVFRKDRAATHG